MQFIKKIFLIVCCASSLFASEKVTVFILHSYSQEYEWTKKQHSSFVSTLDKNGKKFEYYTEYLDTKRLKLTQEYKEFFLKYLKQKYSDAHPDLIYVSDDNALEFIVNNSKELFQNAKDIPIFFSGINNLDMQKTLPKESFAGVYEVKEIKPNIELIKQFSPQTREIYIVGDNSSTYESIKKELQLQQQNFTNLNFNYINDENISKIKNQLPTKPRSFVILTTIGNLKDDANNTLMVEESIDIIRQNKNIIILTMEDAYMYKGVIGGYVTSGLKQGEEAATLVLKYLKNRSLDSINSLLNSPNIYMFDSRELTNARVILSEYIARNAVVIGKDKDFIEKNGSMLLNIFIISLLIVILGSVSIYAVQRRKYAKKLKKLHEIEKISSINDQLIHNIFALGKIGYWRLDTKTDKLFVSQNILGILAIDGHLYKNDSKLLEYFIHPNDRSLFHRKIFDVQNLGDTLTFKHKMITSNNSVLNVIHTVYIENNQENLSLATVGIIQFE